MNNRSGWKVKALLALSTGFGGVAVVSAQTTSDAAADQEVTMERFEVTGSYIPYSADAPAVPVTRLGVSEIQATGETNILEVLRKAVPQFIGNGNIGSSNSSIQGGTTNGGSRLQLRNVQTLVLVNGRRAVFAPVSAVGGYDFVDVNAIPVAAVESIEVLKDGASALYGSDAVSGVVNIILRDDFDGIEIGGTYRFSETNSGHWEERSARLVAGASTDRTSITVSFEWLRADPMFQNDRPFSADQTGKTSWFPGIVYPMEDPGTYRLAEGVNPPIGADLSPAELVAQGVYLQEPADGPTFGSQFNIAEYVTLELGNEKRGFTTFVTHQLTDNIELFGDLLYSETDSFLQLAAQPITGMPFTAKNVSDIGIGLGVTDADHPQNPFAEPVLVGNRFVDNPRRYFNNTHTLRGLLGARGDINENYSWEIAANLNRANQDYINENVVNRVALSNAIDAGLVNLFAREQDPALMAQANIFGTAFSKNKSTLNSFDGHINGEFPDLLPAGSLKFAVGAETRRETLSAAPDAGSFTIKDPTSPQYGSPSMWDGATTTDPFDVSRSVDSFFAEVRVPITSPRQGIPGLNTLDLDVAVRNDRYSDSEDPVVPKAMLRWMPFNDEFVVRASYSESFTAPSLYSLFGPTGVGFSEQIIDFEYLDGTIENAMDQAYLRVLSSVPAVEEGLTDQLLQPEEAENYNIGFIYSPRRFRSLSLEVTYFRIEQTQVTGAESDNDILQDVELEGPNSEFANRVRIGGFNGTPITAPGQIGDTYRQFGTLSPIYISTFNENFATAVQDGVDVSLDYVLDAESVGRFDFSLSTMWFNEFSVDGDDYVGTTNGQSVLNGGTIPRWTGNLRVDYRLGNWQAGATLYYVPSVEDTTADDDETDPAFDRYVESFTRVDVYLGYEFSGGRGLLSHFDGLRVRVGATNVFDEEPPLSAASWTDHNADTGQYGAYGRIYFVDASLKF